MSDIFQLFDGTLNAGGTAGVVSQNAASFSDEQSENDLITRLASGSDSVQLLVDYSDFANFVTFNSAESYVTVTADQILNDYPFDGTVDDLQAFIDSFDGFQKYFLSLWPSTTGHLRLNPSVSSSYVKIDDFGIENGASRTSFMSPGTGSISVTGWIDVPQLTGSNDICVIFQKQKVSSTDGYSVFTSGSSVFFQIVSGSATATVSGTLSQMPSFFSAVIDQTVQTGSAQMFIGTQNTYPILTDSTSIIFSNRYDLASGSFYIGSGSVAGKTVVPFTGSLDDIAVWSFARNSAALTGTFNKKIFAQSELLAAWRFNDATIKSPSQFASIVKDCSGHKLNGRIQSFFSGVLGSGTLTIDLPDPILSLSDPNVVSYVVNAQITGSSYDRNNSSIIWGLFPESFIQQDASSADVFKNFALILARHFDRIKLYINQLVNLRRISYDEFDQSPDELLEEVGKFFGWDLQSSFATTDAMRYFVGNAIKAGTLGNIAVDTKLNEIKSQFWRRTLLNLLYIYKTKGTRESVEALLRSYGVDDGFIRLKEYARKTESRLPVNRVVSEKSVYALQFMSGASVSFTGR